MLHEGRAQRIFLCKARYILLDTKSFVAIPPYTIEAGLIKAHTEGSGSRRDATYVPFWA